jgi:hypothetical protein
MTPLFSLPLSLNVLPCQPRLAISRRFNGPSRWIRVKRALFTLILLTGPVLTGPARAAPADGVYDSFDCAVRVSDQRVTLQGNRMSYYETSCLLTDAQSVEGWGDATLFWAECSGKGQEWRERTLLMTRMGGDLIVVGDGWSGHYAPCPNRQPDLN